MFDLARPDGYGGQTAVMSSLLHGFPARAAILATRTTRVLMAWPPTRAPPHPDRNAASAASTAAAATASSSLIASTQHHQD